MGQAQADALGEHRHAEGAAVGDPLEHRGLQDVHQARQPDGLAAGELLGDHREGGPGRLADAQGQVAGRAAHGHHQVPPAGGDGVGHQVVDQTDPHAPGGLEAKGRRAARQRQVVVDGLRHMRHAQAPSGRPGQPGRRERGVVPADRHQRADPQLLQRLQTGVQPPVRVGGVLVPHRRVSPRGPDDRPALDVDPRHVRDGQRPRLPDPALDQVLEPVHDPQDVPARVAGLDRGRRNDRVHPRGRAAAAQDPQPHAPIVPATRRS